MKKVIRYMASLLFVLGGLTIVSCSSTKAKTEPVAANESMSAPAQHSTGSANLGAASSGMGL